jgi:cellobiose phosphorylase
VDYESPSQKQERLKQYFAAVAHEISGKKQQIHLDDLARDLEVKASWLVETLRRNEWISNQEGHGWFNGYYDNDGAQLEGDHPKGIRMTLTGQVFTLLCGIADDQQARQIVESVDQYLIDPAVGGPRLNTNFKEVLLNMGRCFGFAYGHKENGAMFSHMAVMYAYALYERGFVQQGYQILDDIYTHSLNFEKSRMYPGIPEYFDDRGRGVYPYLTGSASWYIFTLLTQAFGVRGHLGDLKIRPKLVASQFDVGDVQIRTTFAGRKFNIIFKNPDRLDYGQYRVGAAFLNNEKLPTKPGDEEILIPRESLMLLDPADDHQLTIHLADE